MRRSYNYSPKKSSNTALKAATASVIIIALLVVTCIIELIVLAVLNIRLNSLEKEAPIDVEQSEIQDVAGKVDDTESPSVPTSAQLSETEDYGMEYIDKIIFVGDSTTHGMKSKNYHVLTGGTETKQVWTADSGTLSLDPNIAKALIRNPYTDTNMTISEAAGQVKPEYMILTVGINNGVPFLTENEFKFCYKKLIDSIISASPSTKLILQSIYPVATNNTHSNITNEKIDNANTWIKALAEEYGIKYLDTNSALKGSDGYLPLSYQNGDGLHLNREGFTAVLNYIRTHGYPQN